MSLNANNTVKFQTLTWASCFFS